MSDSIKNSANLMYGVVPTSEIPDAPMLDSHYIQLRNTIKNAGLYSYHSSLKMFIWLSLIILSGFAIIMAAVLLPSTIPVVMVLSFLFGVHAVQVGFIGHDFAHNTGFKSRNLNRFLAHITWAYIGNTYDIWHCTHTRRHHLNTMNINADPTVQSPLFANHKYFPNTMILKRWNHLLAHFMTIIFGGLKIQFEGFFTNILSHLYKTYTGKSPVKNRKKRMNNLLAVSLCFIIKLISCYIISDGNFFLFLISISVFYLGGGIMFSIAIFPNHHHPDVVVTTENSTWSEQQIMTSQSISGGLFKELFISPCNKYHIEHHLFPNITSWNYKKIQPYVKEFAKQHNYQYLENNLIKSHYYFYLSLKKHNT